jgi:hypothetical protein
MGEIISLQLIYVRVLDKFVMHKGANLNGALNIDQEALARFFFPLGGFEAMISGRQVSSTEGNVFLS